MLDYRDKLVLEEGFPDKLAGRPSPGHDPQIELWECVVLTVAATVLKARRGFRSGSCPHEKPPSSSAAQARARHLRAELLEVALQAEGALGGPAVTPDTD